MDKDLSELWARIHVRTGLSLTEFLSLDFLTDVPAILDALREKDERDAFTRAQLYAVINRSMGGTASVEDFIAESNTKDELAQAKLDARAAAILGTGGDSIDSGENDEEGDSEVL